MGDEGADRSFEVVLPNGKICPASDHGIPDFNAEDFAPTRAGITEVDGVIYVCGGRRIKDNGSRGQTSRTRTILH